MSGGKAAKKHERANQSKNGRRVAHGAATHGAATHSAKASHAKAPQAPVPAPKVLPPPPRPVVNGNTQQHLPPVPGKDGKYAPVNVITWDDPVLDRRIIEGMLTDRQALMTELSATGITQAAVLRRAADLGLSEAYLRHVQTVAADLAGDRPGARRLPSSLAARNCLSCSRIFLSSGAGNRICPRCRGADAGLAQL